MTKKALKKAMKSPANRRLWTQQQSTAQGNSVHVLYSTRQNISGVNQWIFSYSCLKKGLRSHSKIPKIFLSQVFKRVINDKVPIPSKLAYLCGLEIWSDNEGRQSGSLSRSVCVDTCVNRGYEYRCERRTWNIEEIFQVCCICSELLNTRQLA